MEPRSPVEPGRSRPVMDIRPRPMAAPVARRPMAPVPPSRPAAVNAPMTPVAPPTNSAPTSAEPLQSAPQDSAATEPEQAPDRQPFAAPKPAKNTPIIPIVIAIVVATCLIGVTLFVFLHSKESDTSAGSETSQGTAVQPEEVEASSQAVEDELNTLDDAADFSEAEITDETLGL